MPAQEPAPHVDCVYCNHIGDKPCKRHSKKGVALETDGVTRFCSKVAECKACGGTLRVDCPHCENEAVEARNRARADAIAKWLAKKRAKVDELVGHKVLHGQSRWFYLVCDLKPMMVGRVRYSTHDLLHLYLKRLEELRARFEETLEVTDRDLPDVCDIYLWRDGRDQALAALKFTGMGASGSGIKLMGASSVYTMHFQRRYLTGDDDLHRHLVHNVTHLLVSQMTPANWIGKLKAGWVDAGLAHYFEFKLDGKCTTYCYQEVQTQRDFKGGKWLVPVRRMVASGRHPSFAEIATKNTDQLEPKEHALAFSYVHFLLEGDFELPAKTRGGKGAQLTRMIRLLKAKRPAREGLRTLYGWTPFDFEEEWKAWVLATYPSR